jgi:poly(hydroxyalkanoate) granule-associated protein
MRGSKKAEVEMDKRVEDVLARMNIPTKAEIEALSAKITTLTKKVDELKKAQ